MYFVYILFCDRKTYYVGYTDNLRRRLDQHKQKESTYTKKFTDITLVYFEQHEKSIVAKSREKQIKKWSIAKKKALIEGDIDNLKKLSHGLVEWLHICPELVEGPPQQQQVPRKWHLLLL